MVRNIKIVDAARGCKKYWLIQIVRQKPRCYYFEALPVGFNKEYDPVVNGKMYTTLKACTKSVNDFIKVFLGPTAAVIIIHVI